MIFPFLFFLVFEGWVDTDRITLSRCGRWGGSLLCALAMVAGRWLGFMAGRHRIICHDDDVNWKSHILATDSMTSTTLPHQHLRPSP